MNRVLKFRAWNRMGNELMYYSLHPKVEGKIAWNEHFWSKVENDPDSYKIMQFTGLLDKNGKEIYEGDIVEEENETFTHTYTIEWDEYDCCFYPKALNFRTMIEQRMSSNYTEFKVIGNIYEHPELLK